MNYCGIPSMAKVRNFAYLSPIFRASTNAADLRYAFNCSMLSHCRMVTRDFGGVPSIGGPLVVLGQGGGQARQQEPVAAVEGAEIVSQLHLEHSTRGNSVERPPTLTGGSRPIRGLVRFSSSFSPRVSLLKLSSVLSSVIISSISRRVAANIATGVAARHHKIS